MVERFGSLKNARKVVADLVDRYARNRDRYRASAYNEETTRNEFINPLFEAFGWDIQNRSGAAEQYKDVIHEESIKVGDYTKAPDYTFRFGGVRKFFVEAKKPSVDLMGNPGPAFQLRRYAWTAHLPLSILTDFEEFAVYDTRIKPTEKDRPSVARILYFSYEDLPKRLDEIWSIFSKDAVLKGSFDHYADDTLGKRGTSEVDNEFLKEIEGWRDQLARNIALRNGGLSVEDLNYAVQTTIDRIIFLRIAEGRGVEQYGQLLALVNGAQIYERLVEIYRRADHKYNSGLFDFGADKLTTSLAIDDKILKGILEKLYYPKCPYEFSVLPGAILGNVYEQFLGKVIRLTEGHRAKVEEKPEVKKAGGVYYTPSYIVDYIVSHTVGTLTEGKSPRQMEKLRVLDPACGSGSFLIAAYQLLLDRYLAWYQANQPAKHRKAVFLAPGGWRLATAEKRRILLNNIYGVDIDRQAVEVTKLSLLLKVLEGENEQTLHQQSLFGERALPSLEGNIKCGNSLVEPDYFEHHQSLLFNTEEQKRVNAICWETEFSSIMKAGGFDVVIGNPPYGADYDDCQKHYFQSKYVYKKGKPETYLYFVDRGLSVLRENGLLGYITPNAWLTNHYGEQVRRFLLESCAFEDVVDLEPTRVFERAVVDTAITILRKERPGEGVKARVWQSTKDGRIECRFEMSQRYWEKDEQAIINLQANPLEVRLLEHLEGSSRTLGSLVEYSQGVIPYKTKADGLANRHIAQTPRGQGWLPLLESASQVRRYEIDEPRAFIHYGSWLWCARERRFFSEPKILFHRLRKKLPVQLVGGLDETGLVNRHSLSNLIMRTDTTTSLRAVLGLFNSRVANWWFVKRYGVLMEVGGFKVCRIPLPHEWATGQGALVALVNEMISLHRRKAYARTPPQEAGLSRQIGSVNAQIDRLLYKLYGISEDEIRLIEEATAGPAAT